MAKGWKVKGAVQLPEIAEIVREELVTDEYFASTLAPEISVKVPEAKIKVISAGQDKRLVDTSRAQNGSYKRLEWAMTKDFFDTSIYGIEVPIDNMEAYTDEVIGVDDQAEAGKIAVGALMTGREARVSTGLFDKEEFTGADYSSDESGSSWLDKATDLDARLEVGKAKLFNRYGLRLHHLTLVLHIDMITKLARIIAKEEGIKETKQVLLLSESEKAEIVRQRYGVKKIVAIQAVFNDVAYWDGESQPASFEDIYPDDMAMLCLLVEGTSTVARSKGVAWQPVFTKMAKDYILEQYSTPVHDGEVVRAKEWRGLKIQKQWGFLYFNIKGPQVTE